MPEAPRQRFQFEKGYDFQTGQTVTQKNLDDLVDEAYLRKGAISEQGTIPDVNAADELLINDVSDIFGTTPKKVTVGNLLNASAPVVSADKVVTNLIESKPEGDIIIDPKDKAAIAGAAFSSADGKVVSVTHVDHGLSQGDFVVITSATNGVGGPLGGYNGRYIVGSITNSAVFTYILDLNTTAASGTLTYQKEGTVEIDGNLVITGNERIGGSLNVVGDVTMESTGALRVAVGTSLQRPSTPRKGSVRFNDTNNRMEFYNGTEWVNFVQTATQDSQSGWIFMGYTKVDVTGFSFTAGTGARSAPLFEQNIAIPEGEYWNPVTDLILDENLNSSAPLEAAGGKPLVNGYNVPVERAWSYENNASAIRYRLPFRSKSLQGLGYTKPQNWTWGRPEDVELDEIVIPQNDYGDYAGADNLAVGNAGVFWNELPQQSYYHSTIGYDLPQGPLGFSHAYEVGMHVNSYVFFATSAARKFIFYTGTDGGGYDLRTRQITNILFYLIPANAAAPDGFGTYWATPKGIRGGQNIKIRRKALTFTKAVSEAYTERFSLVFERWKRA